MCSPEGVRTVDLMTRRPPFGAAVALIAFSSAATLLPALRAEATSKPQVVTGLASYATTTETGNSASTDPQASAGGRFIAFRSNASDLVPGDTNKVDDIFVRDTLASSTVRVSVSGAEAQANSHSSQPSISADGRFVAFTSSATNLVAGDTNGFADVFVRDLVAGTTVRASLVDGGPTQVTGGISSAPSISNDGNLVAFESTAPNLVPFEINGKPDVFVRNISANDTEVMSVTGVGGPLNAGGTSPMMTDDGNIVTFDSTTNQVGLDTNGSTDVFLRDRTADTIERVSISNTEMQGDGSSQFADVSDSGRYIAFQSTASNLTIAAENGETDVFVRDRVAGTTQIVSRTTGGFAGNAGSSGPSISADGQKIGFASSASDLVPGDTNGYADGFVRNLGTNTLALVSVTTTGTQLNGLVLSGSISPDGGTAAFTTLASNLFDKDTNQTFDVYWRGTYDQGPWGVADDMLNAFSMDFNGAPSSPSTRTTLKKALQQGVASPPSVIDDLAHGTFDQHRGPVMRLYWSFFHRVPDLNGLNYWIGKNANGMSLNKVATSFAGSSEFKNTYGALSNQAFVKLVYLNVLERQPDAAGLSHWVKKLDAGMSRGEMMTAFSESSEGVRKMRPQVDSILVFLGMLRRLPTTGEFTNATAMLTFQGGKPTEVLIDAVLRSQQYALRVK